MPDREITQAEYEQWLMPHEAYAFARNALQTTEVGKTMWALLTGGIIRMAAQSCSLKVENGSVEPLAGPALIPLSRLSHYTSNGSDFGNGTLRFFIPGDGKHRTSHYYTYFGVRIDPHGLAYGLPPITVPSAPAALPTPESTAPLGAPEARTRHPGGAPRKPFWDDLWAAMGALIYKGTLHPGSKSKDIEDAMVQWAIDHNEDLSVPSARMRARKLLDALRAAEKDNN